MSQAEILQKYKELNWDRFQRKDLGQYNLDIAKESLDRIKLFFDFIYDFLKVNKLPAIYLNKFSSSVESLYILNNAVSQFQNLSERGQFIERINKYEIQIWNELKDIIEYIRFVVKENNPDIEPYLLKIEEAGKLADRINSNKKKYEEATELAENWPKMEGRTVSVAVGEKSDIFNNKADEHKKKKIWWWFVLSIIIMLASIFMIIFFIYKNGAEISIGAAILRISTLVVLSYFSFFCLQQFSNHRRLYEVYKFKAIALKTIEELYKSYTGDHSMRQQILEKGIGIIFSEPVIKENTQLQQKFIDEMMEVIKSKLS